ncbi:hypothetical protein JOD54_000797 [Actinokineospora baliensis]|uniref:hypothetical protein n=1 Tax=Actinokineospora baliensis TaxID=547056 RepID=UPI001958D685|nr:hypothetical protein [Actinokineospora baliensis]MBM7770593.1 hypothetical protein [Actinokineospora baliensis]
MTGYTVDPADLAAAATVLRSAVAEFGLAEVDAGPGRVNSAVAAFTADTRAVLTSLNAGLEGAAAAVTAARDGYLDADSDAARRLG